MENKFLKDSLEAAKSNQRDEMINFMLVIFLALVTIGIVLWKMISLKLSYIFLPSAAIAALVTLIFRAHFFKEKDIISQQLSYLQKRKIQHSGDQTAVQQIEQAMHDLGYATRKKFQKV